MLGEFSDYYNRFWFFDLILHSSSGILIGLVGFVIMYFFLYSSRVTANPLLVSVLCVSFSLAAGALWEIFEFGMDQLFGFNMQKSGNVDTMSDLIVDFLGACIVGFGVYRYLTRDEDGLVKLMINRFIQYNMKLRNHRMLRKLQRDPDNVIPHKFSEDLSKKLDQS
jgi:H+/Cl- antiporter ClcA